MWLILHSTMTLLTKPKNILRIPQLRMQDIGPEKTTISLVPLLLLNRDLLLFSRFENGPNATQSKFAFSGIILV